MGLVKVVWDVVAPEAFTRFVDGRRAQRAEERVLAERIREETGRKPERAWRRWFEEQKTVDGLAEDSPESLDDLVEDLLQRLRRALPPWRNRDEQALAQRARRLVELTAEGWLEALDGPRGHAVVEYRAKKRHAELLKELARLADLSEHPPQGLQPPEQLQAAMAGSVSGFAEVLVGREAELIALRDALSSDIRTYGRRIVLLEGPGGFGKTRLALEVAREFQAAFVARTGIRLGVNAFVNVPTGRPALVLVDDVHRCEDLSGLSAALGDPRYDSLHVILTSRPGLADARLATMGLTRDDVTVVPVGPLTRSAIDSIVTSYGSFSDQFRTYVIDIAHGSPLVAHLAARTARETGQYGWQSTMDLMTTVVTHRLKGLNVAGRNGHRAAATALALRTLAEDGHDLSTLAPAVTTLTDIPHELDELLADLADAGIASGRPYVIQPDLVAIAIVSRALDEGERVHVNIRRLLPILGGLAASAKPVTSGSGGGVLGIAPLPALWPGQPLDLGRLETQLAVLTQAALHADDSSLISTLATAVRELLPDDADLDTWLAVLGLARPVSSAAPALSRDLVEELSHRWPVNIAPSIWDDIDPQRAKTAALRQLGEYLDFLAQDVIHLAPDVAAWIVMQKSWLVAPALPLDLEADDPIRIEPIIGTEGLGVVSNWSLVLERRAAVCRTVLVWLEDARSTAKAVDDRPRHFLELLAYLALKPFLTVVVETLTMGTPSSSDTLTMRSTVLPADPTLMAAAGAIAGLLTMYDLADAATEPLSRAIAELPGYVRSIAARGLPGSAGPLPDTAKAAMNAVADLIARATADQWSRLPLRVRRAAAVSTLGFSDERPSNLRELAEADDPIAVLAMADPDLAPLLVLQPIDEDLGAFSGDSQAWQQRQQGADRAASALAQSTNFDDSIGLLRDADPGARTLVAPSALNAFARTLGRATDRVDDARQALMDGLDHGAVALLDGLLEQDRSATQTWLLREITSPRIAILALQAGNSLDEVNWQAVVEAVRAEVVMSPETTTPTGLMYTFLKSLWLSDRPVVPRLMILAGLGRDLVAGCVPEVLKVVGQVIRTQILGTPGRSDVNDDLVAELVSVIGRLNGSRAELSLTIGTDHGTGYGIAAIAMLAPAGVGRKLAQRIGVANTIVHVGWEAPLQELPHEVREAMAEAFRDELAVKRAEGLDEVDEFDAQEVLKVLGGDDQA